MTAQRPAARLQRVPVAISLPGVRLRLPRCGTTLTALPAACEKETEKEEKGGLGSPQHPERGCRQRPFQRAEAGRSPRARSPQRPTAAVGSRGLAAALASWGFLRLPWGRAKAFVVPIPSRSHPLEGACPDFLVLCV